MNWEQFFAMGGYAVYVWTSYGLMAVILVVNVLLPLWHHTDIRHSIARRLQQDRRTP